MKQRLFSGNPARVIAALMVAASPSAWAVGGYTVTWTGSASAIGVTEVPQSGSGKVTHTEKLSFTPSVTAVTVSHGSVFSGSLKLDRDWLLDLDGLRQDGVQVTLNLANLLPFPSIHDFSMSKFSYEFRNDGVGVAGFGRSQLPGVVSGGPLVLAGPLTSGSQVGDLSFDEIVFSVTMDVLARSSATGAITPAQGTLIPTGSVSLSWTASPVPEPGVWLLAMAGLGVVAGGQRLRRLPVG